ncbi:MAG: hypothetical protein KBF28_05335 [Gemmatimonadales bacterium]|nr:hypothetical protein [Gemmatimonadales bacterium]
MTTLETRRAALEARLTRGYAWFVAHGYEPTTATGVDAVDGDRKAEKAEAVWLELLSEYCAVCDAIAAAQPEQARLAGVR